MNFSLNRSGNKPKLLGWAYLALSVILTFCCITSSSGQSRAGEFWQTQNIYQVITDRFYDGDPSNNNADGNYNPAGSHSIHGGDFKGIEQKLDYIKALGATAIWISPVVLNANGEFHGYAARDFYKVDPHWGTLEDLKHMIQAAHARGLLVIDDVIVNHGGNLIDSVDPGYPEFKHPPQGYVLRYRRDSKQFASPFNTNSANPNLTNLFHNSGVIQNYNDPDQVELGELSGLDDFRTESPYIRSNMVAICEYWIREAGFDAFRIDTVKHVEMEFWQYWCPLVRQFAAEQDRPNFFMFGEVYDGSDARCGAYTGTRGGGAFKLDSTLDYPLYFAIKNVFASGSGNTAQIEKHYAALAANYDPAAQNRLVTFLDNHDQARFLSSRYASNNLQRLQLALVFLYTARGIPCLYYGTEQGFNGETDPYDREDMFAGQFEQGPSKGDNFDMTHPLFQWVARLNNLRRLYPALVNGTHCNEVSSTNGPGLLAYSRLLGSTQEVFVVLNTAASPVKLPRRMSIYPGGTKLINLLDTNEIITINSDSRIPPVPIPGTFAKIFIPKSQLRPLDPVVISCSPAHDATGISDAESVIVRFSQPMDKSSVQSAFSVTPATHGKFEWSASGDELKFTPDQPWPESTDITVRIAATARDCVSGSNFYAGFEGRFRR